MLQTQKFKRDLKNQIEQHKPTELMIDYDGQKIVFKNIDDKDEVALLKIIKHTKELKDQSTLIKKKKLISTHF